MIDILYDLVKFLYNGALQLIDLIALIPSYVSQLSGYNKYLNPVDNTGITLIIAAIVGVYVTIKLKRLIT